MSRGLTRTDSLRKHIRPIVDIEEEDDDQRRDSSGRKRVDVVQCLLDSSSDENDDENINIEKANPILWLTFNEICHIRYVLAQTNLSLDKQSSEIRSGSLCFRCRRKMNQFSFLPSFFRFSNHEICFICQQMICKKCSYSNFQLPSAKLSIPIRIQTLIKTSSMTMNHKKEINKDSTTKTKPICYDCLQIFNDHIKISPSPLSPLSPLRRTFSLPPISSKNSNEVRHTRHRRRPVIKLKKPS